ncbi:hypothetical protein ACFFX1_54745 [Dactylosporangium sucinum]|uniref:Uncharacterized protein n=1 Tax=Dactylosporangium sucinum TaxID=1424081 RepID=A0A917X1T8_9ACTN|nr:hypothetical protein [Dactylosporangium sucinum]GGM53676.1 hypothetical protein GCM10007977_064090 [Dactylosporangium sucinum]
MTAPRFWADDFDADLLRVVPRAAGILVQVTAPLWTYGHTSHGRLNHPSVWASQHGYVAYFGTDNTGTWKPGSFSSNGQLVQCTWTEAARDAWVHNYVIAVDYQPIWDAARLVGTFAKLMGDVRGRPKLPDVDADRLRGHVLASLIAATGQLQQHIAVRAAAAGRDRCPECRCNPVLCETDDTGEHCADQACGTCLHGCPLDNCPACPAVTR